MLVGVDGGLAYGLVCEWDTRAYVNVGFTQG